MIAKNLKKNSTIVFESTVYPGCTEEICVPIIEKYSRKKLNRRFFYWIFPRKNKCWRQNAYA